METIEALEEFVFARKRLGLKFIIDKDTVTIVDSGEVHAGDDSALTQGLNNAANASFVAGPGRHYRNGDGPPGGHIDESSVTLGSFDHLLHSFAPGSTGVGLMTSSASPGKAQMAPRAAWSSSSKPKIFTAGEITLLCELIHGDEMQSLHVILRNCFDMHSFTAFQFCVRVAMETTMACDSLLQHVHQQVLPSRLLVNASGNHPDAFASWASYTANISHIQWYISADAMEGKHPSELPDIESFGMELNQSNWQSFVDRKNRHARVVVHRSTQNASSVAVNENGSGTTERASLPALAQQCPGAWRMVGLGDEPPVGSVVQSVNGVSLGGLDRRLKLALLSDPRRPISMDIRCQYVKNERLSESALASASKDPQILNLPERQTQMITDTGERFVDEPSTTSNRDALSPIQPLPHENFEPESIAHADQDAALRITPLDISDVTSSKTPSCDLSKSGHAAEPNLLHGNIEGTSIQGVSFDALKVSEPRTASGYRDSVTIGSGVDDRDNTVDMTEHGSTISEFDLADTDGSALSLPPNALLASESQDCIHHQSSQGDIMQRTQPQAGLNTSIKSGKSSQGESGNPDSSDLPGIEKRRSQSLEEDIAELTEMSNEVKQIQKQDFEDIIILDSPRRLDDDDESLAVEDLDVDGRVSPISLITPRQQSGVLIEGVSRPLQGDEVTAGVQTDLSSNSSAEPQSRRSSVSLDQVTASKISLRNLSNSDLLDSDISTNVGGFSQKDRSRSGTWASVDSNDMNTYGLQYEISRERVLGSLKKSAIQPKLDTIPYDLFLSKYNHPAASRLRRKVDGLITAYLECDWVLAKADGTGAPQDTVLSLYRYIEAEMSKLGLFDRDKPRGEGMPEMNDKRRAEMQSHIEVLIFKRTHSFTLDLGNVLFETAQLDDSRDNFDSDLSEFSSPKRESRRFSLFSGGNESSSSSRSSRDQRMSEDKKALQFTLHSILASLVNVTPEDLGLRRNTQSITRCESSPGSTESFPIYYNRLAHSTKWCLAIRFFVRALTGSTPGAILKQLVIAVQMITHALEAHMFPDTMRQMYCDLDDKYMHKTDDTPGGTDSSCAGTGCAAMPAMVCKACGKQHMLSIRKLRPFATEDPSFDSCRFALDFKKRWPCPENAFGFGVGDGADTVGHVVKRRKRVNVRKKEVPNDTPGYPPMNEVQTGGVSEGAKCFCNEEDFDRNITADELMPAIAWVIIQANPPNIDSVLWLAAEFRHPDLLHGEEAYCLSNVSSAVEFCRRASAESFDIPTAIFDGKIRCYEMTKRLIMACKHGHMDVIRECIKHGANANGLSPDHLDNCLSACIRHGQVEALEFLLADTNVDVNMGLSPYGGDAMDTRPLILAAQHGNLRMVLMLLKAGADRDLTDGSKTTALDAAAFAGARDVWHVLATKPDAGAMHRAVSEGSINKLLALMLQDVNCDILCTDTQRTPLMDAVEHPRLADILSVVRSLLSLGRINVNKQNQRRQKETALILCAKRVVAGIFYHCINRNAASTHCRRASTVSVAGTSVDNKSDSPRTVRTSTTGELSMTLTQNRLRLLEDTDSPEESLANNGFDLHQLKAVVLVAAMLLRAGADRNMPDGDGLTPADYLKQTHCLLNASKVSASLTAAKSSVRGSDRVTLHRLIALRRQFESLLMYSPDKHSIWEFAKDGNKAGMESLIAQGAELNARDPETDLTALSYAAKNGDHDMLMCILQGAKSLQKQTSFSVDGFLNTWGSVDSDAEPIESFFVVKRPPIVVNLDLDACDNLGMTALHYAASRGDATLTGALLAAGASREAKDRKGRTPQDVAEHINIPVAVDDIDFNGLLEQEKLKRQDVIDVLRYDPNIVPICKAARYADWPVMSALIRQGVSPNYMYQSTNRTSGVFQDISTPSPVGRLSQSTTESPSMNLIPGATETYDLCTPLIATIAHGKPDITDKLLLIPHVDVNLAAPDGRTPLMFAAQKGDERLVLRLLHNGADRTLQDHSGRSAEAWALTTGNQAVAMILKYDPLVYAIHDVICDGNFPAVLALFKQNVDPNSKAMLASCGDVAMNSQVDPVNRQFAAFYCNQYLQLELGSREAMVLEQRMFIKNKTVATALRNASQVMARARLSDTQTRYDASGPRHLATDYHLQDGITPLMVAAAFNEAKIVSLLLKAPNIAINARDGVGTWTAVFHAASEGHEDVVLQLLRAGASRRLVDCNNETAAEIAMRNGHASTAALLEADPRTVHIHDACFEGRTLVVLALLKQGCPPCYRDNREGMLHQTPLMAAASAGAYEVVKVLLSVPEIRENVDLADDLGHTALMRAAGAGALQVTPLILSAGCDRNRTDRRGRTAREHAANHGVSTMLKYMSQMVIYKEIK